MSGRKSVLQSYQIVTNGDMSANITSKSTNIQFLDNIAISLQFPTNAAATGTFFVDASIDGLKWVAIDISPAMNIPDPDNALLIDMNLLAPSYLRVRYVFTSGTGTLNAFISGKEV